MCLCGSVLREQAPRRWVSFQRASTPEAKSEAVRNGTYPIDFGKAWIKSPSMVAGQAPIKKYNRQLMEAILWDRMPYLGEVMNVEVVSLDKAIDAYRLFDEGSPKKYIIDPHNSLKKAA